MAEPQSTRLGEKLILFRHAAKNALLPLITILGLQLPGLISGSFVIEFIFAWPGMGRLLLRSVLLRDLAVVQAGVMVFALVIMFTNLVVDILYAYLDPRIRYS